jgi:hypothetical protein
MRTLAILALCLSIAACNDRPEPTTAVPHAPDAPSPEPAKRRLVPISEEQAADFQARIAALRAQVAALRAAGHITDQGAARLNEHLDAASRAIGGPGAVAAGDEVTVQQIPVLGDIVGAVRALLRFLRTLIDLATDLPNEVVDPIVFAVIDLISDLLGLLAGV